MRGSCTCGAVAFEVEPPLREVVACHCRSCRKQSGHFWAATLVPKDRFRLIRAAGLAWVSVSAAARRGFCNRCGSFLFWEPAGEDRISLAAGAIDGPTGLAGVTHIFAAEAGDYYAPEGSPPPPTLPAEVPVRLAASCLCGANRFSLPGPAGGIGACHCTQCRKFSGHFTASFFVEERAVEWQARHVAEHLLPHGGRQGFCPDCGARLYFRAAKGSFSVEAGAVDGPTGGRLENHIFVAEKGDYYELTDGLPQFAARD